MSAVPAAILKAMGQLTDRAVMAVAAKSIAVTLVLFAGLGVGLYFALAAGFAWLGWAPVQGATVLLTVLSAALLGWLLFRVLALAVLQIFADDVVQAVEAKHYPALAARARPLAFHRELAQALRGLLRALGYNLLALPLAAALAFTAIGPALVLLAVNAVLLGRELTDMAWLRHCQGDARTNPVGPGERALLGAAMAGLMLVPFAGLLAPVIGAAAGTHLVLRRLERGEGKSEGTA